MICYRDKTWCLRSDECANVVCPRRYSEDERKRNEDGPALPVSWADLMSIDCGFIPKGKH